MTRWLFVQLRLPLGRLVLMQPLLPRPLSNLDYLSRCYIVNIKSLHAWLKAFFYTTSKPTKWPTGMPGPGLDGQLFATTIAHPM